MIKTEVITSSGRHYTVGGPLAENEAHDVAVGRVLLPEGEPAPYLRIGTAAPIVASRSSSWGTRQVRRGRRLKGLSLPWDRSEAAK